MQHRASRGVIHRQAIAGELGQVVEWHTRWT